MNSTLADIKQLFNVKAIAYSTSMDNLADGQFGVFPEDSNVSVAVGTTFATLPEKFRIISRLGGKFYYSFDTIDKSKVRNQNAKAYQTEQVNMWEGIIQHCNCVNGVVLKINIDEQSLIQRDGLTWTHNDFMVVVSPQELLCFCNCDGSKPVYENNIITKLLYEKIVSSNSPFYTATVKVDITGATTYANPAALDAAVGMEAGDLAIVTSNTSLHVYDGTDWVLVGTSVGLITDVAAFVEANKAINTDDDETNDGQKLILGIEGKPQPAGNYNDLDVNYVYPRGVKIHPALSINNEVAVEFTQTQALRYEIGAGYDLRKEEWDNMNHYTNMNYYPRLSDGIQAQGLVYQFENATNYGTVNFEFLTPKVERNNGDEKMFGVLIGTSDGALFTALTTMFVP